jgi:hypothetical protein
MLKAKSKSTLINKKRLLLGTAGALLLRQAFRFWLGDHKTTSNEWLLLWTCIVALLLLIITFWVVVVIKLAMIFFQHFGTGWVPIAILLMSILLFIIGIYTALKNYVKYLAKKWLKTIFLLLSGI